MILSFHTKYNRTNRIKLIFILYFTKFNKYNETIYKKKWSKIQTDVIRASLYQHPIRDAFFFFFIWFKKKESIAKHHVLVESANSWSNKNGTLNLTARGVVAWCFGGLLRAKHTIFSPDKAALISIPVLSSHRDDRNYTLLFPFSRSTNSQIWDPFIYIAKGKNIC